MIKSVGLGLGVWGNKGWVGRFFPRNTKSGEFLKAYASTFNAVEASSSFYGLPVQHTLDKWKADTPDGFRFCFKFPREITHERKLGNVREETAGFLRMIRTMESRLGPCLLQLPPSFDTSYLPALNAYISTLPKDFEYAVEVRHPSFFHPNGNRQLTSLLLEHSVNRVILDRRATQSTASVAEGISLPSEPDAPIIEIKPTMETSTSPFIRFVGLNEPTSNLRWLSDWCPLVADWIQQGRFPLFFLHTINDLQAPELAKLFHGELSHIADVGSLPSGQQLNLF